jgi:hypothetical protein
MKDLYFVAITKTNLERAPDGEGLTPSRIHIVLDMSDNLDREKYYCEPGVFNKDGATVFTDVAIDGLVANIHLAHQKNWRDSAEHLKYIINRLTAGFATPFPDAQVAIEFLKSIRDPEAEKNQQRPDLG